MDTLRVFNPDDYLQTPEGRVYTDERNAAAWERIYAELEAPFRNAIAVWINVPLERALEQNANRAPEEVVPEVALRSVFGLLEAPTVEEGFLEVIEVTSAAETPNPELHGDS